MNFKLAKFSTIFFTALLVCLLGYFLQPKTFKGESIFTLRNSIIMFDSQHINLFVMSPSNIYNILGILKVEKNKENYSKLVNAIAMQKIDNDYTRISISGSSEEEVNEIFSAVIFELKSTDQDRSKNKELLYLNNFFIKEVKFIGLFTALFFSVISSLIVYFISEFIKND